MKFDPKILLTEYLINPNSRDSFVYISSIQQMRINLFGSEGLVSATGDLDDDSDAQKPDIPIPAFDVIITDECHRGISLRKKANGERCSITLTESKWVSLQLP